MMTDSDKAFIKDLSARSLTCGDVMHVNRDEYRRLYSLLDKTVAFHQPKCPYDPPCFVCDPNTPAVDMQFSGKPVVIV